MASKAKKSKPMTAREKKERAEIRKRWREEGLLPQPKKPLNRKKFLADVERDWDEMIDTGDISIIALDHYLCNALAVMRGNARVHCTPESIGALKVMRMTVDMHRYCKQREDEGTGDSITIGDLYEHCIKDTIDL